MTENISNIDDILVGLERNKNQYPSSPLKEDVIQTENNNSEKSDNIRGEIIEEVDNKEDSSETFVNQEVTDEVIKTADEEVDEYGNKIESMTEGMKKRLKKQADKYESRIQQLESQIAQLTPNQYKQIERSAQNIHANSEEDWQKQFEVMVEQTVNNMHSRRQHEYQHEENLRLEREFERKLFNGMERFSDFKETIRDVGCEITNHMTNATRSLDDPAAFLYAASKRHPEELKRISQLRDPYAQVREMGKLEEKMRKGKVVSNTPRSISRTQEDASFPFTKTSPQKPASIDDILAKNDANRLADIRGRQIRR